MGRQTRARDYFAGMGQAVADRTINRLIPDLEKGELPSDFPTINWEDPHREYYEELARRRGTGIAVDFTNGGENWPAPSTRRETWGEVADRVSKGNVLLEPRKDLQDAEFEKLNHHLRQASLLMSGRHLQHGDETQPTRNMEVFTNCGCAETEFATQEFGITTLGERVGETVTVRCADGIWRKATVNAHGVQKLYRLIFERVGPGPKTFQEEIFTRNHRWLLDDGTVTDRIEKGDVLLPIFEHQNYDPRAVIHGALFGDGSAHKRRYDKKSPMRHQGREYGMIRVCKQDKLQEEFHTLFDEAGYNFTTPVSANGDRVYYVGKFLGMKEPPFTRDPSYVAGFIHGWWMADGNKDEPNGTKVINTVDEKAAQWLLEHAVYAGLTVVSHRVLNPKDRSAGSFPNAKPLHIIRLRSGVKWRLSTITPLDERPVFCVEEPVTRSFTLANGLVTGNCSTAATTFLMFYLLLNGSGVGRAYDDDLILADLNHMPIVVPVIDWHHQDVERGIIEGFLTERDARHLYKNRHITIFKVPDSREGWAKGIEIIERMAFEKRREEVLIIDFSDVRPKDSPIAGMQNRPASGPGPLMSAISSIARLRDAGMASWRAAIYADHYAAECVLVGGARRAARMATKNWRDKTIFDFIDLKEGGFLWSANNSVTVDQEFRDAVVRVRKVLLSHDYYTVEGLRDSGLITEIEAHAYQVAEKLGKAAYYHGTGEPGIINQDRLVDDSTGIKDYADGLFADGSKFSVEPETRFLMRRLAQTAAGKKYRVITNPCGEIVLFLLGGYCVIADVVPFFAENDDDAEDAFRTAVRALIRTNLMDCIYHREVKRTNRIGVGMTGFHEWVYKRFKYTWHDMIDEDKSRDMWLLVSRFARAVSDEAEKYSSALGVTIPHTDRTFKPAGTTSKLFGLCEGAHLPTMREFLRWVQFRNDDPLVKEYENKGYPVKRLKTYEGTTIVGFPTKPAICELDGGDWIVTASEATPQEQYQFLRLLEKYWIRGVEDDGETPLSRDSGNQVSYTLKYNPREVDFDQFFDTLIEGQFSVKCCSVMPQTDTSAYEYLPETPVNKAEYEHIARAIQESNLQEDVDFAHIDCASGSCPIDFAKEAVA